MLRIIKFLFTGQWHVCEHDWTNRQCILHMIRLCLWVKNILYNVLNVGILKPAKLINQLKIQGERVCL